MWFIKIKKKKTQYLLLSVVFAVTVMLIATCTVFTVVSNVFVREFYSGDGTPDISIITMSEKVKDKALEWYKDQGNEVRNLKIAPAYSISNNLKINDKALELNIGYIMPISTTKELSSKISIVEGTEGELAPKVGEIWISSLLAGAKDITIGDYAYIKNPKGKELKFRVSALINDSGQPDLTVGTNYMYINKDEEKILEGLIKGNLITFNCNEDRSLVNKEINKYIDMQVQGWSFDKDILIMAATITPSIIGGIGLVVSILLTVVLIIIVKSNLWNNILKEYKSIGIYKAMGFSSKNIKGIYLKSYGIVAVASAVIGCVLSIPVTNYICNKTFKYLGEYSFDLTSFLILVMVFVTFNIIVIVNLQLVLRRISKIKPVTAINIGVTSSKAKLKKSIIKDNASSFAMAINDIFKYKKSTMIMLIMFSLVFYITVFNVNMKYSISNMENNMNTWIGSPKSDMAVIGALDTENSLSDVMDYLSNSDKVKDVVYWDFYGRKDIAINSDEYKVDSLVAITLHNKYDEDLFTITKGRNPRNRSEVSVSGYIMKANNLKLGDYITLKVKDKDEKFLITGQYDSMQGNKQSLRLKTEVLSDKLCGNLAFIKLDNKDDYERLKKELEDKFHGIKVDNAAFKGDISGVKDVAEPIVIVLLIGVAVFSILNVINMLLINNIDNRKNYGIMKAMGFSSGYIRNRILFKVMILAILGAIGGLAINIFTTRELIKMALGGIDGCIFDIKGTAMILITFIILIWATVILCCRGIKKITTVELIME